MSEQQTQVCRCCGKELPLSAFRVSKLGVLKTCTTCMAEHQRVGHAKKKEREVNKRDIEDARNMRLSEFTPRELMCELKRRGYDGTLTFTEVRSINLKKL